MAWNWPKEAGKRVRLGVAEQDGKDRQPLVVVLRIDVAEEGDAGLGAHPPAHAVAADEDDEPAAGLDLLLQDVEPALAAGDAAVVAEDGKPACSSCLCREDRRLPVVPAVAEEDEGLLVHGLQAPDERAYSRRIITSSLGIAEAAMQSRQTR